MPSNIIYVVCHDLGRYLGCYDTPVHSPCLDAFARDGVLFTESYCNSPACTPSRCCAMTGRYAHVSGCVGLTHMGWPLSQAERTIVDYLNDFGYETAHFGLTHERYACDNHDQIDGEKHWHDQRVENAVEQAIAYLRERRGASRPFYLNVGTYEVHASCYMRPERQQAYGGPVPLNEVYIPPYVRDDPVLREAFARFNSCIRFLDRHFGRLVAAIDELGHGANTLVVFTTDHGIANVRAKGTLYDRGTEIALMVRPPHGLRRGYAVDHLIQNIDFAPTLLEMAGAPLPAGLDGRSFWSLLCGLPYAPHQEIFTERNFHGQRRRGESEFSDVYDPVRSVRTRSFHYLRWFDPAAWDRPWLPHEMPPLSPLGADVDQAFPSEAGRARQSEELYHVAHDPCELRDVSRQPEFGRVRADLAGRLARWMQATDDHVLRGHRPVPPKSPGFGPWEQLH
jgi:N-sulfoglucosamine sulfohydrolase